MNSGCLFEAILNYSEGIILALDEQGCILFFNQGAAKAFGYSSDELAGREMQNFLPPESDLQQIFADLNTGPSQVLETNFAHKQGKNIEIKIIFVRCSDVSGYGPVILGLGKEMSAWRQFQDDLIRVDRLAEMGRMSAAIIHELKNPLSVINQAAGWGKVVLSENKDLGGEDREELVNSFQEIENQTKRCRSITDQILESVRETKPESKELDLGELLEDTLRFIQPELKYPPIAVERNYQLHKDKITSDYKLLQQVLINLLSNAAYAIREHRDKDGKIQLEIQSSEQWIRILISDNGGGIPAEFQQKIFDLFYSTKPVGKGTGLGLPICRNIINKLGGDIQFESQPGKGSTFKLILPVSN